MSERHPPWWTDPPCETCTDDYDCHEGEHPDQCERFDTWATAMDDAREVADNKE